MMFSRNKSVLRLLLTIILSVVLIISSIIYININKAIVKQSSIERINRYITSLAQGYNFSGSILVAKGNRTLFSEGFGMSDNESWTGNGKETKYLIGSLTKAFTAVAIMQLEEKHLLKVTDPVSKYIPKLSFAKKITIRQLLNHTSGLPENSTKELNYKNIPKAYNEGLKRLFKSKIALVSKPGEEWNYSNLGYQLLGYIIEKVSKTTYSNYIKENILKPLHMKNSGFGYNRKKNKTLAKSYDTSGEAIDEDDDIKHAMKYFGFYPGAAGGLYSTVGDLAKWDRALYTTKLLKRSSLNQIFTPRKNDYGYGWYIYGKGSSRVARHGGTIYGFNSRLYRWIKRDTCIIILSNVDDDDIVSNMAISISKYVNNRK